MEHKKLNRVFDRVKLSREREDAILTDLLSSKKEVSDMKQTNRRRIPVAALVAAVLAAVLAGTALAAEHFGKVQIKFVDNFHGSKDGYFAYGPGGTIPANSLSEEVLALCANMGRTDSACLPFDSWSDAEEYLGIELADNAVLDQFLKYKGIQYEETTPAGRRKKSKAYCLLTISADAQQHLPSRITLNTMVEKGNCTVSQLAQFSTDTVEGGDKTGLGSALQGETSFQDYVTPSGLEVTICSKVIQKRGHSYAIYSAYFVKNGAFFTVELISNENWRIDETVEYYDPWETLIKILDAYE